MVRLKLVPSLGEKSYFEIGEAIVINFVSIDDVSLFVLYIKNSKSYLRIFKIPSGSFEDKLLSEQHQADFFAVSPDSKYIAVSCFSRSDSKCLNVVKLYEVDSFRELTSQKLEVLKAEGNIKKLMFTNVKLQTTPTKLTTILVAVTDGNYSLYLFKISSKKDSSSSSKKTILKQIEKIDGIHESKISITPQNTSTNSQDKTTTSSPALTTINSSKSPSNANQE